MIPVTTGLDNEVVYAKDQPEYNPLPAARWDDGTIATKWKMSLRERVSVLFGGHVYLTVKTFNQPLQPLRVSIKPPWGEP